MTILLYEPFIGSLVYTNYNSGYHLYTPESQLVHVMGKMCCRHTSMPAFPAYRFLAKLNLLQSTQSFTQKTIVVITDRQVHAHISSPYWHYTYMHHTYADALLGCGQDSGPGPPTVQALSPLRSHPTVPSGHRHSYKRDAFLGRQQVSVYGCGYQ